MECTVISNINNFSKLNQSLLFVDYNIFETLMQLLVALTIYFEKK